MRVKKLHQPSYDKREPHLESSRPLWQVTKGGGGDKEKE